VSGIARKLQGSGALCANFETEFHELIEGMDAWSKTFLHKGDQHNIQVMWSLWKGLILIGFQAGSRHGLVLFSLGWMGFGYGCLGTILGYISGEATEEAMLVLS